MADLTDHASDAEEKYREQALAQLRREIESGRQLPTAENCMDCGEMIPSMRQAAVPGTQCCAGCAEIRERAVVGRR